MRKPFVVVGVNQVCPAGYSRSTISSELTNFLYAEDANVDTQDTTLINFLQLLSARKFDFDQSVPFVGVDKASVGICIVNASSFGDNVGTWGENTYTEECPIPWTVITTNGLLGCPQILAGGGLQSCGTPGGVACVTNTPTGTTCPPQGCPQTPAETPCVLGLCDSPAWMVTPSMLGLAITLFA
jgi:hypothetical protein